MNIINLEGGGSAEPPEPPSGYGPVYTGGGMISRVLPVEGLNITDRYEVLACVVLLEHVIIVYLCLANSMFK